MPTESEQSAPSSPHGIVKDDIVFDTENPYRARAVPRGEGRTVLERARQRTPRSSGTYPELVEGSDSPRTGTSWGVLAVEAGERETGGRASTSAGAAPHPNRNTGDNAAPDEVGSTGSWSTIDSEDAPTGGSPSGNS